MGEIKKTVLVTREITATVRILPDFLIIGTQKGGTTSLFNQLMTHPYIYSLLNKEIHFFDQPGNYRKGIFWYRSNFPTIFKKYFHRCILRKPFMTGEATPYYLFHPHVPKRVSKALPHARLIVMLRNPIDRAYSHYHHQVRKGMENFSFEEAIKSRERMLDREISRIMDDESYHSDAYQHHSYLLRGVYWEQLQRWFVFYPKKQF